MPFNLSLMAKHGHLFSAAIGTVPVAAAAGTRNGAAINRRGNGGLAMGCTVVVTTGVTTGAPTSFAVNTKLQDSPDGASSWADYIPPDLTTVAAAPPITTASGISGMVVNLTGAKQYIRAVEVTTFVGGTSPTVNVQAAAVLYGFDRT